MFISYISITFEADSDTLFGMEGVNGDTTVSRNPSEQQGETKPLVPNLVCSLGRFLGSPRIS